MNSAVHAGRRQRRTGALVLILPVLFFLLALFYMLQRPPRGEPAQPPVSDDPEASVAALQGELAGARSTWLVATLVPLRIEPGRRAFEAHSMARELELEPGEPWRLSVRWSAPEAAAAAAARPAGSLGERGPGRAEGAAAEPLPGIALGAVQVLDAAGVALTTIPAGQPGDGARDPLRSLVSPPPGSLRPGQTADWILWGRTPGEAPRLAGLVPTDDAEFTAATGLGGEFELRATWLRRGDLEQPLARLERGPVEVARKTHTPPSSVDELAIDDEL